jgi:uncharacterized protein
VKRYVVENGSDHVRRLMLSDELIATATIAYAETYSALTRRRRERALSAAGYGRLCTEFEDDWPTLVRVELDHDVLTRARALIQRHALRGFDGIHLASALHLHREVAEPVTFVAADDRLLQAAEAEGLTAVLPTA